MESQKNLRTWLVAKGNNHDTSGITDPENWLWERIDGVFYPAEKIPQKEVDEELERMFDELDPEWSDEEVIAHGWAIKYKSSDTKESAQIDWRQNCGHAVLN